MSTKLTASAVATRDRFRAPALADPTTTACFDFGGTAKRTTHTSPGQGIPSLGTS